MAGRRISGTAGAINETKENVVSANTGLEANLFELVGKNTQITYSTSSISGQPLCHYRDAEHDINASGSDIRVQASEIGQQVTVTVDVVPDLDTVTVTLLLPGINLSDNETAFNTYAILTTHTTIAGPQGVTGALQSYNAIYLSGKAGHVEF